MKVNIIGILLFLSFLACGGELASSDSPFSSSNVSRHPIFEVTSVNSPTVYPPGETLDLMHYSDGTAEFDFYPATSFGNFGSSFKSERLEGSLTPEDMERVEAVLAELIMVDVNDVYPPTRPGLDATVQKTIRIKFQDVTQTIVIHENDSHFHLSEKADYYPRSLIRLLELTSEISQGLRRQVDDAKRDATYP